MSSHAAVRKRLMRTATCDQEPFVPTSSATASCRQPFSHKTGHGYVKAHRGFYHDAIFVKRNHFNLLLHETFGGGWLLAHRRSQAAPPRAQGRARQRRPHGLLAQVLALFYLPPCRGQSASLSLFVRDF